MHAQDPPVGAAVLDGVEQMASVRRRVPFAERGGAVLRPAVGIDQDARRSVQPLANPQAGLVLKPVIAGVEIEIAGLLRKAEPLVIVELRHPRADRGAAGKLGEEGAGRRILRGHPVADPRILSNVVLEPAIGIGHALAERGLDRVAALRRRIDDLLQRGGLGLGEGGGGEGQEQESGEQAHEQKSPGRMGRSRALSARGKAPMTAA